MVRDLPDRSTTYHLSVSITRTILLSYMAVMAWFTVSTFLAQNLETSFQTYALSSSIIALVVTGLVISSLVVRIRKHVHAIDWGPLGLLVLTCIGASLLALLTHRPDSDDYLYVPNAVYYLQHPQDEMGYDVKFVALADGESIQSHSWGTSIAFEYAQSVLAYALDLDYLVVYYGVMVAFTGALVPLTLFFMTAQLTTETWHALTGTLLIMAALLVLVETHRTYGNFAFPRLFQGKAVMLTIGLPTFVGFSFSYFGNPTNPHWLALFATSTALLGMTTSTVPVLSAQAVVMLAGVFTARLIHWNQVRIWGGYLTSLALQPLYALFLLTASDLELGIDSVVNEGWPRSFMGHLRLWITPGMPQVPLTGLSLLVVLALCLKVFPPTRKRLIIGWSVAACILFLNPAAAGVLIRYVTTQNTYWRLFYILPFLLSVGLIGIQVAEWFETKRIPFNTLVPILLAVPLLALGGIIYRANNTMTAAPQYKLESSYVKLAETIIENTPEGTMLAPKHAAYVVPMLRSSSPQVINRDTAMQLWMGRRGYSTESIQSRLNAVEYVGGDQRYKRDFLSLLDANFIDVLVMERQIHMSLRADGVLAAHGFEDFRAFGDYTATWKTPGQIE